MFSAVLTASLITGPLHPQAVDEFLFGPVPEEPTVKGYFRGRLLAPLVHKRKDDEWARTILGEPSFGAFTISNSCNYYRGLGLTVNSRLAGRMDRVNEVHLHPWSNVLPWLKVISPPKTNP